MSDNLGAQIQSFIDEGLGYAAEALGSPYSVYRCDGSATGDFPNGWSTLPQIFLRKQRVSDAKIESAMKSSGTLFYQITANMSAQLLGDVFVNADAAFADGASYGIGASSVAGLQYDGLTVASHASVGKPFGARLDSRVKIMRGDAPVGAMSPGGPLPTWGSGDSPLVDRVLVLTKGVYAFSAGASGIAAASWVPAGFGANGRPASAPEFASSPKLPTATAAPRFFLYLPPLPGYTPVEGDRIYSEDGSQYTVLQPYSQTAGFVGSQLVLERSTSGVK